jgi:hypothetical protein
MYQIFSDTLRRSLTFSTILRHSLTFLANFHLISLFSIIIPSLFCLSAIFVIFHIFLFIHPISVYSPFIHVYLSFHPSDVHISLFGSVFSEISPHLFLGSSPCTLVMF